MKTQIRLARLEKTPYDELYAEKDQSIEAYKQAYEAYKVRFLEVSPVIKKRLKERSRD